MRKRIPLKLNTELRFRNQDNGIICFYTGKAIGFGGTCVVYDGYYKNNAGQKRTVRIKECCQTAHCGRCEQHFIVGAFTSPTVRFGR